jgi:hypothetical protein
VISLSGVRDPRFPPSAQHRWRRCGCSTRCMNCCRQHLTTERLVALQYLPCVGACLPRARCEIRSCRSEIQDGVETSHRHLTFVLLLRDFSHRRSEHLVVAVRISIGVRALTRGLAVLKPLTGYGSSPCQLPRQALFLHTSQPWCNRARPLVPSCF